MRNIIEKMLNKEIVPDFKGHNFLFQESFLDFLKDRIDRLDKCSFFIEEDNEKVICHLNGFRFECTHCGQECGSFSINKKTYEITFLTDLNPCKWNLDKIETKINVDSALIFANVFFKDNDYLENEIGYLDNDKGLFELAKLYEKQNILFGQMGNMLIYFYKENDSILILREKRTDLEFLGKLDLIVWRFMITTEKTVKDLGLEIKNEAFRIEIPKGKYKLENYYGFSEQGNLIAKLEKI